MRGPSRVQIRPFTVEGIASFCATAGSSFGSASSASGYVPSATPRRLIAEPAVADAGIGIVRPTSADLSPVTLQRRPIAEVHAARRRCRRVPPAGTPSGNTSGNIGQGAGINPVGKPVLAAPVLDVLDRQRVAAGFGEPPRQHGVAAQIDVVVRSRGRCPARRAAGGRCRGASRAGARPPGRPSPRPRGRETRRRPRPRMLRACRRASPAASPSARRPVRSAPARRSPASELTANRSRFDTPSGVWTRNACTACGTFGAIVTSAVTSYFFAPSSMGASVRTTPFGDLHPLDRQLLHGRDAGREPGLAEDEPRGAADVRPLDLDRDARAALGAGRAHLLKRRRCGLGERGRGDCED